MIKPHNDFCRCEAFPISSNKMIKTAHTLIYVVRFKHGKSLNIASQGPISISTIVPAARLAA